MHYQRAVGRQLVDPSQKLPERDVQATPDARLVPFRFGAHVYDQRGFRSRELIGQRHGGDPLNPGDQRK